MMKRFVALAVMIIGLIIAGPIVRPAYAADVLDPACESADTDNLPTVCKESQATGATNPLLGEGGILTTVVNLLSVIAGVVAVIVILISGVRMITSGGNSESTRQARSALLYAVISLIVVALAQIIVGFILNAVG